MTSPIREAMTTSIKLQVSKGEHSSLKRVQCANRVREVGSQELSWITYVWECLWSEVEAGREDMRRQVNLNLREAVKSIERRELDADVIVKQCKSNVGKCIDEVKHAVDKLVKAY